MLWCDARYPELASFLPGIEATVNARDGNLDKWVRQTEEWRTLGATYVSISTMGAGFISLGEHIEAIRRYKEAVAD